VSRPDRFSWIERPHLAASARPDGPDELAWLRAQGIQLLVTLSEEPLRRDWVNDAGLLALHVPVVDMEAPTQEQIDRCVSALARAHSQEIGAAVHCTAGLGRTGTILAAYFVHRGLNARDAIARVRELRPGSIETDDQEQAIFAYARRLASGGASTSD
jgi:atypical dual specificity phosphatase